MKSKILYYITVISALIIGNSTVRSQVNLVSNVDSVSFIQFADSVHRSTGTIIYYKREWVSDLYTKVDLHADLGTNLSKFFYQKGLYYYIHPSGNIYITRNIALRTELSPRFGTQTIQNSEETITSENSGSAQGATDQQIEALKIITIGKANLKNNGTTALVSGFIRDEKTGEPIVGANVYTSDLKSGSISDVKGYYQLTVQKGRNTLIFKYLGKKEETVLTDIHSDGPLNISLADEVTSLSEITIVSNKSKNVAGVQIGLEKLDIKTIVQIPAAMGETDVLKAALLLPGVQTVGEGASGMNVRGGYVDQNLIMFDEAPVYNTSHLFGFFSSFNPDVVKNFDLYKSSIPARYGGRLSSVVDIESKNGNMRKFSINGGISPVTLRATVEAPLIKDRSSVLASFRSTYSDWILKQINDPDIQKSGASFYDLTGKFNLELNRQNHFTISIYNSSDYFNSAGKVKFNYGNLLGSASWKHFFSTKLYSDVVLAYSKYRYKITDYVDPEYTYNLKYSIDHKELKTTFSYFPDDKHTINAGFNAILYNMEPGERSPATDSSNIKYYKLSDEQAFEGALFISDDYALTNKLLISGGLRFTFFQNLGPQVVNQYQENITKSEGSIIGSESYGKNKSVATYTNPEYRLSLRYKLAYATSLKAGVNTMTQYLHILSNTVALSPYDIWKLSDRYIPPQKGIQYAAGIYQDLRKGTIELSVEGYYKESKNNIDYKGGADLKVNPHIETELITAIGKAYGVEFMMRKPNGKLNGWISYTWSRSFIRANGTYDVERINDGQWFPSYHDKPHNFSFVQNYKFNRRWSISNTIVYNTGKPVTYPTTIYNLRNTSLIYYSQRNEFRLPYYFRWDLSLTLDGNLKKKKPWHGSWTLAVYNLTGRDNIYSVYFVRDSDNQIKGYKMSIFSQPIPTLSYNFRF